MYATVSLLSITWWTIAILADPGKGPGLATGPDTKGYYQFPDKGPGNMWINWYASDDCTDKIEFGGDKLGRFPTNFNPNNALPKTGFSYTITRDLVEGEKLDFSRKDGVGDPCGIWVGAAENEWRLRKGGQRLGCHPLKEGADCHRMWRPGKDS